MTDREAIRAGDGRRSRWRRELTERYPAQFRPEAIQNLLVNRSTMWAFLRGEPLRAS